MIYPALFMSSFIPAKVLKGLFIALVVAFATISVQSIKAALANPMKSLRSE